MINILMEREENLIFIRGEKLIPLLFEDKTYGELDAQIVRGFPTTTKRQHSTQPIQIVEIGLTPYIGMKTLYVKSKARSNHKIYDPQILFKRVEYEEEDTSSNITFMGSDGNEYHMQPISLRTKNIRVRCNCLDFYYRFAVWNHRDAALSGRKPKPYLRKTDTYPPVNPDKVSGVCKHIIKTIEALTASGMVVR